MRKVLRILSLGVVIIMGLVAVFFIAVYVWVSNPKHERLPLPADLISLEATEGKTLLAESEAKVDHESLESHVQMQEKGSWCGVASGVSVLNSMPSASQLTQTTFFNACADNAQSSFRTTFGGMTLDTLARLLQCHGVDARAVHTDSSTLDEFRRVATENLKTRGNFVIINYDRSAVGQTPGGHISPLSAYHAASDRFLVLDVASYKYPPVWVKAPVLWSAMTTIDGQSKRSRGYVLVAAAAAGTP